MTNNDDDPLAGLDPHALARAEAALDRLSSQYGQWAKADMAALQAALAEYTAQPSDTAALARLHDIAHDMKGQGTTFGHPQITEIGAQLCHTASVPQLTRLVQAMAEVLAKLDS